MPYTNTYKVLLKGFTEIFVNWAAKLMLTWKVNYK